MRILIFGVLALAMGTSLPAQQETDSAVAEQAISSRPVAAGDFKKNLWSDQKAIWTAPLHARNYRLRFVVPFAAATAALIAADKSAGRELSEGPAGTGTDVSRGISRAGTAVSVYGFAGAFYGLSRLTHHERAQETGLLALEALIDSSIVVTGLKAATQRQRPTTDGGLPRLNDARGHFGAGGWSFPSGHAINAWSLASVMAARYPDRPLVKYGAYSVATAVAVSRVTARRHFPSDVLVGSVLGYLIGHYVVRAHSPAQPGGVTMMVLPEMDSAGRQYGVRLDIRF
jgi:membrane-associated phospholipid phosphatase